MLVELKVPSPGESITEVTIDTWLKADGDFVKRDEPLAEIQSDKATLTVYAEESGRLKIMAAAGDTVEVGKVIATIDTDGKPAAGAAPAAAAPAAAAPVVANSAPAPAPVVAAPAAAGGYAQGVPSPSAQKLAEDKGLPLANVVGTGRDGRITKTDVVQALNQPAGAPTPTTQPAPPAPPASLASSAAFSREIRRVKMSQLRKTLAGRLVSVKNETAMLTTFNEVDMTSILALRKKYKDKFAEKHGVNLGFMSFFSKACAQALKEFPAVNAAIDETDIIYHDYVDMGIAVSTDRGLMVPVVRNVESLSLADIEKEILRLADRARTGKITIEEMQGGTFTITNGGVFGSLLSTPILNPPQSGILGMHKTQERPVAMDGQVVIRPMMYLALSYDHRIIDGKESVSFLVRVKEYLEDPSRMLLGA